MDHGRSDGTPSALRLAAGLFTAFFAAQSAFIVLAPTLPQVAREFGVSVGAAGQLRTVASVAGVAVAVTLIPLARRVGVRGLLLAGLAALAAGAGISAVAPGFAVLAAGQLAIGAGVAGVLSAGLAAAGDWASPEDRTRVLAWTTVGQPAAWVAGLPLVGVLSNVGWRWGWLIVPAAASVAAVVLPRPPARAAVPLRARDTGRAWRDKRVRRWAFGEFMAYAGWGGTLVYAGALFGQSYGLRAGTIGLLLGMAAAAYFPGTFAARRRLDGDLRALLGRLALALSAGAAVFGLVRPSALVSTAIFMLLVLAAGARTITGSAFGLNAAPGHKVAIGGMRSAAMQLGYLLGAGVGGIAVDAGGYSALGVTLAAFFAAAALPHLTAGPARRSVRVARRALAPIYARASGGFLAALEPVRFIPLRGRVVVLTRHRGRGRPSGAGHPRAHVWELRGGRPILLEVFADSDDALRAGGRPCGNGATSS